MNLLFKIGKSLLRLTLASSLLVTSGEAAQAVAFLNNPLSIQPPARLPQVVRRATDPAYFTEQAMIEQLISQRLAPAKESVGYLYRHTLPQMQKWTNEPVHPAAPWLRRRLVISSVAAALLFLANPDFLFQSVVLFGCGLVGQVGTDTVTEQLEANRKRTRILGRRGKQSMAMRILIREKMEIPESVRVPTIAPDEEVVNIQRLIGHKLWFDQKRGDKINTFYDQLAVVYEKEGKKFESKDGVNVSQGHTRYATTGSKDATVKQLTQQAHPHTVVPGQLRPYFIGGDNGHPYLTYRWLENAFGFNGDLDKLRRFLFNFFGIEMDNDELREFLAKWHHIPLEDIPQGDAPTIAALLDLFHTQGFWYPSLKLALAVHVNRRMKDNALPKETLEQWATLFDIAFDHFSKHMHLPAGQTVENIPPQELDAFIQHMQAILNNENDARKDFLKTAFAKIEDRNHFTAVLENMHAIIDGRINQFVEASVKAFAYNSLPYAVLHEIRPRYVGTLAGTFLSTVPPKGTKVQKVILAWGQPASSAFDEVHPEVRHVVHLPGEVIDAALISKNISFTSDRRALQTDPKARWRLDLNSGIGEAMVINHDGKQVFINLYSGPDMEPLNEVQVQARVKDMHNPKEVDPLPEMTPEDEKLFNEHPMEYEIQRIPDMLKAIDNEYAYETTGGNLDIEAEFARVLIQQRIDGGIRLRMKVNERQLPSDIDDALWRKAYDLSRGVWDKSISEDRLQKLLQAEADRFTLTLLEKGFDFNEGTFAAVKNRVMEILDNEKKTYARRAAEAAFYLLDSAVKVVFRDRLEEAPYDIVLIGTEKSLYANKQFAADLEQMYGLRVLVLNSNDYLVEAIANRNNPDGFRKKFKIDPKRTILFFASDSAETFDAEFSKQWGIRIVQEAFDMTGSRDNRFSDLSGRRRTFYYHNTVSMEETHLAPFAGMNFGYAELLAHMGENLLQRFPRKTFFKNDWSLADFKQARIWLSTIANTTASRILGWNDKKEVVKSRDADLLNEQGEFYAAVVKENTRAWVLARLYLLTVVVLAGTGVATGTLHGITHLLGVPFGFWPQKIGAVMDFGIYSSLFALPVIALRLVYKALGKPTPDLLTGFGGKKFTVIDTYDYVWEFLSLFGRKAFAMAYGINSVSFEGERTTRASDTRAPTANRRDFILLGRPDANNSEYLEIHAGSVVTFGKHAKSILTMPFRFLRKIPYFNLNKPISPHVVTYGSNTHVEPGEQKGWHRHLSYGDGEILPEGAPDHLARFYGARIDAFKRLLAGGRLITTMAQSVGDSYPKFKAGETHPGTGSQTTAKSVLADLLLPVLANMPVTVVKIEDPEEVVHAGPLPFRVEVRPLKSWTPKVEGEKHKPLPPQPTRQPTFYIASQQSGKSFPTSVRKPRSDVEGRRVKTPASEKQVDGPSSPAPALAVVPATVPVPEESDDQIVQRLVRGLGARKTSLLQSRDALPKADQVTSTDIRLASKQPFLPVRPGDWNLSDATYEGLTLLFKSFKRFKPKRSLVNAVAVVNGLEQMAVFRHERNVGVFVWDRRILDDIAKGVPGALWVAQLEAVDEIKNYDEWVGGSQKPEDVWELEAQKAKVERFIMMTHQERSDVLAYLADPHNPYENSEGPTLRIYQKVNQLVIASKVGRSKAKLIEPILGALSADLQAYVAQGLARQASNVTPVRASSRVEPPSTPPSAGASGEVRFTSSDKGRLLRPLRWRAASLAVWVSLLSFGTSGDKGWGSLSIRFPAALGRIFWTTGVSALIALAIVGIGYGIAKTVSRSVPPLRRLIFSFIIGVTLISPADFSNRVPAGDIPLSANPGSGASTSIQPKDFPLPPSSTIVSVRPLKGENLEKLFNRLRDSNPLVKKALGEDQPGPEDIIRFWNVMRPLVGDAYRNPSKMFQGTEEFKIDIQEWSPKTSPAPAGRTGSSTSKGSSSSKSLATGRFKRVSAVIAFILGWASKLFAASADSMHTVVQHATQSALSTIGIPYHVVIKGDTLSQIFKTAHIAYAQGIAWNPQLAGHPDLIIAGKDVVALSAPQVLPTYIPPALPAHVDVIPFVHTLSQSLTPSWPQAILMGLLFISAAFLFWLYRHSSRPSFRMSFRRTVAGILAFIPLFETAMGMAAPIPAHDPTLQPGASLSEKLISPPVRSISLQPNVETLFVQAPVSPTPEVQNPPETTQKLAESAVSESPLVLPDAVPEITQIPEKVIAWTIDTQKMQPWEAVTAIKVKLDETTDPALKATLRYDLTLQMERLSPGDFRKFVGMPKRWRRSWLILKPLITAIQVTPSHGEAQLFQAYALLLAEQDFLQAKHNALLKQAVYKAAQTWEKSERAVDEPSAQAEAKTALEQAQEASTTAQAVLNRYVALIQEPLEKGSARKPLQERLKNVTAWSLDDRFQKTKKDLLAQTHDTLPDFLGSPTTFTKEQQALMRPSIAATMGEAAVLEQQGRDLDVLFSRAPSTDEDDQIAGDHLRAGIAAAAQQMKWKATASADAVGVDVADVKPFDVHKPGVVFSEPMSPSIPKFQEAVKAFTQAQTQLSERKEQVQLDLKDRAALAEPFQGLKNALEQLAEAYSEVGQKSPHDAELKEIVLPAVPAITVPVLADADVQEGQKFRKITRVLTGGTQHFTALQTFLEGQHLEGVAPNTLRDLVASIALYPEQVSQQGKADAFIQQVRLAMLAIQADARVRGFRRVPTDNQARAEMLRTYNDKNSRLQQILARARVLKSERSYELRILFAARQRVWEERNGKMASALAVGYVQIASQILDLADHLDLGHDPAVALTAVNQALTLPGRLKTQYAGVLRGRQPTVPQLADAFGKAVLGVIAPTKKDKTRLLAQAIETALKATARSLGVQERALSPVAQKPKPPVDFYKALQSSKPTSPNSSKPAKPAVDFYGTLRRQTPSKPKKLDFFGIIRRSSSPGHAFVLPSLGLLGATAVPGGLLHWFSIGAMFISGIGFLWTLTAPWRTPVLRRGFALLGAA